MPLDTVIQIWKGDAGDVERVTSAGMRAIFSTCWYLDHIRYGQDWDTYYRCEQLGMNCGVYWAGRRDVIVAASMHLEVRQIL